VATLKTSVFSVHVLIVAQKASNQELWVETIYDRYPEIGNVFAVFSENPICIA